MKIQNFVQLTKKLYDLVILYQIYLLRLFHQRHQHLRNHHVILQPLVLWEEYIHYLNVNV